MDAVRIANDSAHGLAATVWTADDERGLAAARRIHSGSAGINHYDPDVDSPTTMTKASGLGSKLGPENAHHLPAVSVHRPLKSPRPIADKSPWRSHEQCDRRVTPGDP